jgi:hypothetical protein
VARGSPLKTTPGLREKKTARGLPLESLTLEVLEIRPDRPTVSGSLRRGQQQAYYWGKLDDTHSRGPKKGNIQTTPETGGGRLVFNQEGGLRIEEAATGGGTGDKGLRHG